MYVNRLNSIDALLDTDHGAKADDKTALEDARRDAALTKLRLLYVLEMTPLLRTSARALLALAKAGDAVRALAAEFTTAGFALTIPPAFLSTRADVESIAAAMVTAGLIDAHDPLVADILNPSNGGK